MKLIDNKIIADEGKKIRDKNDIYIEEHIDENGNYIPEHFPYYTEVIYVPKTFTEEMMYELYVEEEV